MLEELNELLAKEHKDLPEYRNTVTSTGNNLLWLRKAFKNVEINPRLRELLNLEIKELNKK